MTPGRQKLLKNMRIPVNRQRHAELPLCVQSMLTYWLGVDADARKLQKPFMLLPQPSLGPVVEVTRQVQARHAALGAMDWDSHLRIIRRMSGDEHLSTLSNHRN